MMRRIGLLAAVATVVATTAAPGQVPPAAGGTLYPVKKCDDLKVPIGSLPTVSGQVIYLLGKDGKPDTATVAVVKLSGMSVAGFRSVARRQLSACRFDVGTTGLDAAIWVVEEVRTDSERVTAEGATTSAAPQTSLAIEPFDIPKDSFPLPIDNRRTEERPRRLSCPYPVTPTIRPLPARNVTTDAQAQAATSSRNAVMTFNDFSAGTLVAQVRVGIDGKPGTQVRVISVSNPPAAQKLAELIGGCRFVPARYHGVLVPAFVETTMKVYPVRVP